MIRHISVEQNTYILPEYNTSNIKLVELLQRQNNLIKQLQQVNDQIKQMIT